MRRPEKRHLLHGKPTAQKLLGTMFHRDYTDPLSGEAMVPCC
eukprot:CAMPEP_0174367818 /NCGR_PEP_ID=MMETSP0811_2-20130205/86782_1 /TAXON_ID=73025 ORGANISM="Eutreptiella gymnastica-like, Strain CCMP1594" /NCGR_SAMPLE_ID=MMETSP0811_2 /ASSEMBLY_ACC=CAM_ASM_000667 /LENGTH=41 /DNA_ID= /DNA_START= /DNA_END= /DNA_ORIENTATION=